MNPLRLLDRVRRRILVHRRVLGASFAGVTVWLVVQAATAPPPHTVPVWTAAHDLPSGTVLTRHDLARTGFAPGSVPAHAIGSVGSVLGRTLATPLGAGDPVTPAHLAGSERLAGYPGRAAVAVRIPDPAVAALLSPGQRVALVASDPQGGQQPERIADDAAVIAGRKPDQPGDARRPAGRVRRTGGAGRRTRLCWREPVSQRRLEPLACEEDARITSARAEKKEHP
jgi:Flp pilus assembly protein CpaB